LATEVEEDSRYMIWKTRSARTNSHWLHVHAEDASVAWKEPRRLISKQWRLHRHGAAAWTEEKKDNTDTTIKKEILN
jgi:hypothetical protein